MTLTHDDVRRLLQIVDEAEHLEEVELKLAELHLHLRRSADPAPPAQRPTSPAAISVATAPTTEPAVSVKPGPQPSSEIPPGTIAIRAPMLGSFYRSPAPSEPPFVEVGQAVKAGDTVCLIEVMKLFNSIKTEVDGVVADIRVSNGELVEFDQVVVLIKTGAA